MGSLTRIFFSCLALSITSWTFSKVADVMTGVIGLGQSISACTSSEAVAVICPRFGSMVYGSPVSPPTATNCYNTYI